MPETVSIAGDIDDERSKNAIRLNIPRRMMMIPGAAFVVGAGIGIIRGGRTASLRFLAENAHRPPTTVQGWYFYKKTKNYRVMLGGLKGAGVEASRLTVLALGLTGIEEGLERLGWGEAKEIGAAVGTALIFSGVYRLPLVMARRTVLLGALVGGSMKGMEWGRMRLGPADQRKSRNVVEDK